MISLQANCSLTSLNLCNNYIGDASLALIADALKACVYSCDVR